VELVKVVLVSVELVKVTTVVVTWVSVEVSVEVVLVTHSEHPLHPGYLRHFSSGGSGIKEQYPSHGKWHWAHPSQTVQSHLVSQGCVLLAQKELQVPGMQRVFRVCD
jgi:hypothetical protein